MKKVISIMLTITMIFGVYSAIAIPAGATDMLPQAKAVALEKDALSVPTADGILALDVGYKFVAEHDAESVTDFAKNNKYANCPMDFVITTDKDIPAGAVTIAGFYAHHDANWVSMTPDTTFPAGEAFHLLQNIPGGPYTFTYVDVATFVKEFYCGAKLNDESAAGATMTVTLYVFPEEEEPIVIDAFSYTFRSNVEIPKITSVTLEKTDYIFDNTAKTPSVIVTDENGDIVDAENYTVTYKNNTKAGTATAIVTFSGQYEGSVSLSFNIRLAKAALKVFNVSAKAVALTWNRIVGAQYYKIYEYNTKTKQYKLIAKTANTHYTVSNKAAATSYTYIIRACFMSVDGTKEYASLSNTATALTRCAAPAAKAAVSKAGVTLKWAKVCGAKYYRVYQYNLKTKRYTVLSTTKGLSLTLQKQSKGTHYYLVRAFNTNGVGNLFAAKNFTKLTIK